MIQLRILSGRGGVLGLRDTTMSLSPLDSLLLSLAMPQSLEFQGLYHFIHTWLMAQDLC